MNSPTEKTFHLKNGAKSTRIVITRYVQQNEDEALANYSTNLMERTMPEQKKEKKSGGKGRSSKSNVDSKDDEDDNPEINSTNEQVGSGDRDDFETKLHDLVTFFR